MKKEQPTEEQINGILQQYKAGAKRADFGRKDGKLGGRVYATNSRYSGIAASEANRFKARELENAKLKKRYCQRILF